MSLTESAPAMKHPGHATLPETFSPHGQSDLSSRPVSGHDRGPAARLVTGGKQMGLRQIIVGAILAASPLAAGAADSPDKGSAPALEAAQTLHVGPGYKYSVLTTIRPGTSPRLKFCQYHGRWCYGSYGRWNGWFYGGENTWNVWSPGYWFGK